MNLLLALLFSLAARAETAAPPNIVGTWLFYEKVYNGQVMPEPPSATLRLHFDFYPNGVSSLYWWHEGDKDHCTRRGRYSMDGSTLVEEVTWVDPGNTPECADDPDMQMGRKTRTPISFRGADLAIRFQLNGDALDMVFKRTDSR